MSPLPSPASTLEALADTLDKDGSRGSPIESGTPAETPVSGVREGSVIVDSSSAGGVLLGPPQAQLAMPIPRDLVARSVALASPSRAGSTSRAYTADWGRFEQWCRQHGLAVLPADEETIRTYLAALRDQPRPRSYSTIARAYASIRVRHADEGVPLSTLPSVVNALKNIAREIGAASSGKAPLTVEHMRAIARTLRGDSLVEIRDRAMLLVGWAAAMRRSEVVQVNVADVRFVDEGAEVLIRFSKTDQQGDGALVPVAFGSKDACPVRAVQAWLDASGVLEGALFRNITRDGRVGGRLQAQGQAVDRAVKRAVERIGLDSRAYGAHSLRSGLATSAAKSGKGLHAIMKTGRWKSERIALGYIRHGALFDSCANEGLL
jgi:site-specific recombinase XerD